jgi:hypothetical protein
MSIFIHSIVADATLPDPIDSKEQKSWKGLALRQAARLLLFAQIHVMFTNPPCSAIELI